jgi:hypothetical protein
MPYSLLAVTFFDPDSARSEHRGASNPLDKGRFLPLTDRALRCNLCKSCDKAEILQSKQRIFARGLFLLHAFLGDYNLNHLTSWICWIRNAHPPSQTHGLLASSLLLSLRIDPWRAEKISIPRTEHTYSWEKAA